MTDEFVDPHLTVIHGVGTCEDTTRARARFDAAGRPYRYVDLDVATSVRQRLHDAGFGSTPVVVTPDGAMHMEPSDEELAAIIAATPSGPVVGQRATWTRTFGPDEVEAYARITGDRNPLHFDAGFAEATRVGRLVVQGGLTTGLFNALVAMELPGPGSVFLHQEWDYPAPVFIGDTVTAEAEVIHVRGDKPITRLRCVARRDDGTEVLRGECLVYTMLRGRPSG